MSAHYTFILSLTLAPQAASENAEALRYVFRDDAPRPSSLPQHKFFETFDPQYRFQQGYRNFQPSAWQCAFWMAPLEGGTSYAGVNLCLPGNKLEGVAQDLFPFVQWLATMSNAQGPVGIVFAEDLPESEPMVLYVRNQRLYIGASNPIDAKAVDDGSP